MFLLWYGFCHLETKLLTGSCNVTFRVRVDAIGSDSWMCIGVRHPQQGLDRFPRYYSDMSNCTYYLSYGVIYINKNMVTAIIFPCIRFDTLCIRS
jgi:hypothetical protein